MEVFYRTICKSCSGSELNEHYFDHCYDCKGLGYIDSPALVRENELTSLSDLMKFKQIVTPFERELE